EAVAAVGDRKRAVGLGRHLDEVRGTVVRRWRWSAWCSWGWCQSRNRHGLRLVVDRVRDEHARHGVLLTTQQRKVQLPKVLEAGCGVDDLHRIGLSAFSRPVVE